VIVVAAEVDVDAPPEIVWRAATDWVGQGRWMPLTKVSVVAGDGASVGSRVLARTGVRRLVVSDPMVVTEWSPPHRCTVEHQGRVVRGLGVFVVEPRPGGRSRFGWEERLPDGGLFGAVARLTAPVNRAVLRLALRRFARAVEAGESPS
jgi:uncharacterized protein YndB with AHSA1/START domain